MSHTNQTAHRVTDRHTQLFVAHPSAVLCSLDSALPSVTMRQRSISGDGKAKNVEDMERAARAWIEEIIGRSLGEGTLHEALKSGVVLCEVANKVKPSICPPASKGKLPFHQMENISAYLRACTVLGLPAHELFQTVDLFEDKNMKAVLINLHALGRVAQQMATFDGPKLGVRDNSRLSVSHAAPGANLASTTKAGYAWPVQQAHDSMLTLLAEAAAAARKIARVKKVVADKARSEAAQKAEALKEADREYSQALQQKPQLAPELKKAKEQAEVEAKEAAEQAQTAQEAAFQAEEAAQEAKKAYDAEAALAAASGTPLPISLDDALLSEEAEPPAAAAPPSMGAMGADPSAAVPPPLPEGGRPRATTPASATAPSAAAASAPAQAEVDVTGAVGVDGVGVGVGVGGDVGAGGVVGGDSSDAAAGSSAQQQLRAALTAVESERDALRAMCDGLAGELREARLREQSLRRMISLALEEAIPSHTEVESASFTHAPAAMQ